MIKYILGISLLVVVSLGIDILISIPDTWDVYKNDIIILLTLMLVVIVVLGPALMQYVNIKTDKESNNEQANRSNYNRSVSNESNGRC